jgi:REP element-mobilizing transposase RayT
MARPLRITFPGAFYHITSRGNERKNIFKSKRDREKFLEYLESSTQRYIAVIHAYCLLDNHYHLLLETPSGNLSQIMRHINGAYTTYFNVKRKRSGHLFQGRYKAILVDADEYAKELSRYIHLNPVRAKMVEAPDDYVWSSYQYYIGRKKPPEWLTRDLILGYFNEKVSTAQQGYHEFVSELVNKKYDSPLNDTTSSTLLGSPDFIASIKEKYLAGKNPDKEIPALQELHEKISIQQISALVDTVLGDEPALSRNVKLYLSRKYTGERLKNIGGHFGIGESGVSQATSRMTRKMANNKKLKGMVNKIEKELNLL